MAASIPVMRVLFRDVAITVGQYRSKMSGYATSNQGSSGQRSALGSKLSTGFGKSQNSTIITSIGPPVPPKNEDVSFLDDSAEPSPNVIYAENGKQIVQTNEVSIKWSHHGHDRV